MPGGHKLEEKQKAMMLATSKDVGAEPPPSLMLELCYMTGHQEDQRANFKLLATHRQEHWTSCHQYQSW